MTPRAFRAARTWLVLLAATAGLGVVAFACGSDDVGGPSGCEGAACDGGSGVEGSTPVDGTAPATEDARTDAPPDDGGAPSDAADSGDAEPSCPGPAGTLDPTFGDGGMVWLEYPAAQVGSVAVQPDGKVIVGGATQAGFGVVRLLPTGALDATWGTNGLVTTLIGTTGSYSAVALQPDGKIVAVGGAQFNDARSLDFAVARYLTDGGLDPNFGQGGVTTTDFGPPAAQADSPRSVVVQPDGRILVGGFTEASGVTRTQNFALARYNADGALDATFGTNGKAVFDLRGTADAPGVLALTPEGRIVMAGGSAETTSPSSRHDVAAIRVNEDGSLDTSFSDAGVLVATFGTTANSPIRALAVDSLGRATLVGRLPNVAVGPDFAAVRLRSTGLFDTSFGDSGVVTADLGSGESSQAVLLQQDGRLLLAGTSGIGPYGTVVAVTRLNLDGTLDPTFGVAGVARTLSSPNASVGADTAALAACGVVTAGVWFYQSGAVNKSAIGIARFRR